MEMDLGGVWSEIMSSGCLWKQYNGNLNSNVPFLFSSISRSFSDDKFRHGFHFYLVFENHSCLSPGGLHVLPEATKVYREKGAGSRARVMFCEQTTSTKQRTSSNLV